MQLLESLARVPPDQLERVARACGEWTGTFSDDLQKRVATCLTDRTRLRGVLDELSAEEWAALKVVYFNGGDHGITVELCHQIVNLLSGRRRGSSAALAGLQDRGLIFVRSQNYRQVFFIPDDLMVILGEVLNEQLIRRVCLAEEEPLRPSPTDLDLVEEVHRFLAYIHKHEVTLTQQGQIFKRHLRALLAQLGRDDAEETLVGRYPEPLGFLLGYCMDRHLIQRTDGHLVTTEDLDGWLHQSRGLKQADLFAYWQDRYYYHDLQSFLSIMRAVERRWFSLPRLAAEMEQLLNPSQRNSFQRRLNHHLSTFLAPLGIVELAFTGSPENPELACRLLPDGNILINGEVPETPTEEQPRPLVLQATFEAILPRPAPDLTLWKLELMADLVQRTDRTLTYRLSRQSIYRALKAGIQGEEILDFLQAESATGVPQNVAFDLKTWCEAYGQVYLEEVTLLRCATPMLAEQIKSSRRTRRFVLGELTPRDLIVDAAHTRELTAALEAEGLMPGPPVRRS